MAAQTTVGGARWRWLLVAGVLLLLIIAVLGGLWLTGRLNNPPTITIDINGYTRQVQTDAQTVGEALEDADVLLEPADRVEPGLDASVEDGMTIRIDKARQLVLEIDGDILRLYTRETVPLAILAEQDIQLGPHDDLYVDHQLYSADVTYDSLPRHLRIERARRYTIFDGGETISGFTTAATVGEILHENNLQLYLADVVKPSLQTPAEEDIEITIRRSSPVHILVDGRDLHTRATGPKVGDVLNAVGLALSGQDYSIPAENSDFIGEMSIEVVRVAETIEVEREEIPYETLTVVDEALSPDEQQVLQAGEPGIQETRIRVRRENNEVVSRTVQDIWTVMEPVPEIVALGAPPPETIVE